MFDRIFLAHPRSVGESYFEHGATAFGFAARLFVAAFACSVHAVVPALFARTASRIIVELNSRMVAHRRQAPAHTGGFDYAI